MRKQYIIFLLAAALAALMPSCKKAPAFKALIVTGQSGHNWTVSSESLKEILDETGMFSSTILTAPLKGEDMSGFNPDFSKYNLVVLDYEGDAFSETANAALIDFVNNGGGLVAYNSESYPGAIVSDSVKVSERLSYEVRATKIDHPVTKGLPVKWLHPDDVLVLGLKPAGEDTQILATASLVDNSYYGTGKREPVLMARNSGKGRIFITMIGTPDDKENNALHCAGFIVTLQRGAEWAVTGNVTQEVPFDFPTAAGSVLRPGFKSMTCEEAFENIGSYDISKSTKYFTYIQSLVRKAAGDEEKLLKLEKQMVGVLKNKEASDDAKKLILRELSWMGTDYCIPAIKALSSDPELSDYVEFALTRLQE